MTNFVATIIVSVVISTNWQPALVQPYVVDVNWDYYDRFIPIENKISEVFQNGIIYEEKIATFVKDYIEYNVPFEKVPLKLVRRHGKRVNGEIMWEYRYYDCHFKTISKYQDWAFARHSKDGIVKRPIYRRE